jgi:Flp pilus assembly pilin Flp
MQSPKAVAELLRCAARLSRREEGQDLLEFGLLVKLIALVALVAVATLGQTIYNVFWKSIAGAF